MYVSECNFTSTSMCWWLGHCVNVCVSVCECELGRVGVGMCVGHFSHLQLGWKRLGGSLALPPLGTQWTARTLLSKWISGGLCHLLSS